MIYDKILFVYGVFMVIGGIFGSTISLFYLGYQLISFHVLIGGVFICYGLREINASFSEEQKEVTDE